jgi:pilus assembly protein CpaC
MIMRIVVSTIVLLALSVAAFGQRPDPGPVLSLPGDPQPDPACQRLQELLKAAYELEQAGKGQDAAMVRRQADLERQSLLQRLDALQAEMEMIRQATGASAQVVVHVQVLEVSLTKLKKLGYDWSKVSGDSVTRSAPDSSAPNAGVIPVVGGPPPQAVPPHPVVTNDAAMPQVLDALRKDNLVRVIAEPTLVTLSGRKAVFRDGGEFPVSVPQAEGTTVVNQRFGNEIEVTPQVLGNKIRLEIHGRIAELDPAHTTQVGKQTVPGIRATEFNTATEMQNGRSLVIRGRTQVREEAENRGVPYLSEIPYAGALVRKTATTRNEIETFVVVRPEIVAPPVAANPVAGPQPMPPAPALPPQDNRLEFGYPSTANRPAEGAIRR